jgi:RHS repeat-associated protein
MWNSDQRKNPTPSADSNPRNQLPPFPNQSDAPNQQTQNTPPSLSLPKGGGAIRGIGEKFAINPVTGTGSMTVPVATSPGRDNFGPQLALSYDSGAGNGPFGFGWALSLPAITRKTDKGLPQYRDKEESDVFILSGAEDLVPVLNPDGSRFEDIHTAPGYTIHRYRPRIEGLFARIERWTEIKTEISYWRTITKDNITTFYGKEDEARIADPTAPERIFSWLICSSYDDKGNAIIYQYKPENEANINLAAPQERNRLLPNSNFSQRYLKRIKYGNRQSNRDANWQAVDPFMLPEDIWLFEVVFDYGEHDLNTPTTQETQPWPVRQDPFSSYRGTFETRTYRLCRRLLMFHHFPEELGAADYLVRSTDFEYKESPIASFITSVTQSGYRRQPDGSYLKKSLPKLEFQYTEARVDETVHEIDPQSLENLPYGVDSNRYRWLDLDSEGLSGVLTEQAEAWFYKRNLGNGIFGPLEEVARKPSLAALSGGRQQFMDLAGDGQLDLVQLDSPMPGFYERTAEGDWEPFTAFQSTPNIAWGDPKLRFVDLTGDGLADVLISEDTVFTWYPSRAEEGFGPAERTLQATDEEKGPKLIFADSTQSIFLADMSGDGLTDLVRIRNGEVCYWPNLGYGRFGTKVAMGNAPVFDYADLFDQRRIRIADIDGSGNSDLIYLGQNEIRLYFNQSGNAWSAPQSLRHFPRVDDLKSITAVDLLGNGTACLVWSSPLASDARKPMRYIALMGTPKPEDPSAGQKPHLLVYTNNHLGAETQIRYAASTQFYLQDRVQGRPWVTKLPFPVHVVERVESRDWVSNTQLVSTYRYRHGYFDGVEREFRGFAYMEQRDAESLTGAFDLPPVVTKTWFHTGAYLESDTLEAYFKDPNNHEYFTGDSKAVFLPDTELPPNLATAEIREACRALKGSLLRQEIYADDGTPKAEFPFSVSERSYTVQRLQPRGPNPYAIFFTHASETIDYHYERETADPRISHTLTLEVDEFGNILKSAAVGYGRRQADPDLFPEEQAKQTQILVTYTENSFINQPNETDWYRIGVPVETCTYELTGIKPAADLFTVAELITAAQNAMLIAYEVKADGSPQKRPIEQMRTLYRKNDLSNLLPLGQLESLALPGESYRLAFTPGLLDVFQSKASRAELTTVLTGAEGQYRDLDGDGKLWIPSGKIFYSPAASDTASQELTFARTHFFLPHRFQDPFGNSTVLGYEGKYTLVLVSTRDAVGNEVKADPDYRVLQPMRITDPNGNRSEVRFDALGMVVGTAVMGKAAGPVEGDSFTTFTPDLTPQEIKAFFDAPDPRALATAHLGTATTRIIYDLEQVPVCAASIAREIHVSTLSSGEITQIQLRFTYSDGFGREAQTKTQAEPGPQDPNTPNSPFLNPRWVSTGAQVYNNKGNPIHQYEPFFSSTPAFGIEQWGVSNTFFYDPLERVVATLHPNHTFEKVVFDPWRQASYDVNDTVTFDPKTDADVGKFFIRLPESDYLPTWYQQRSGGTQGPDEQSAAAKAAQHADTPTLAYFDTLGRPFLTIADNGKDTQGKARQYRTRIELDIEGNQRQVIDAKGRIVMNYDYDLLGTQIHSASMEAGARWVLNEVTGKPIRLWDSRDHQIRHTYDALRRPTGLLVRTGSGPEKQAERITYGEGQANDQAFNLRGQIFQQFDGAGLVTHVSYDFKGNLQESHRQLLQNYKEAVDWFLSPPLETETFTSRSTFDALNRPLTVTTPDGSIYRPRYNEANLLEQVNVNLRGAATATPFITNIDYDAKGQRTRLDYGNKTTTTYEYDKNTFRLLRLLTIRSGLGETEQQSAQDLRYTYDPAGNITHIQDQADIQSIIYFRNQRVEPSADYTYDALYRLTQASGREHIGQISQPQTSWNDEFRINLPQPGDGQAMRRYSEAYQYDEVGNILNLIHQAGSNGSWNRNYTYTEPSLIEPAKQSNRLSHTTVGSTTEVYGYDPQRGGAQHGFMTSMPHLPQMGWDFKDQLQVVDLGGGGTAYYVYDASGQRVRKVIERQNGSRQKERLYLGGFELYREYNGDGTTVSLARETLHVMDDQQRIALVETRTQGDDGSPAQLIRYQLGNHLGSVSLELDSKAQVISYEEYYPYGSTSYQAVDKALKAAAKRYRYTGKERDEETGFSYHEARYYAPWLGRWVSCDPANLVGGMCSYQYSSSNPVSNIDPNGTDDKSAVASGSSNEYVPPVRAVDVKPRPETKPEVLGRKDLDEIFRTNTVLRQRVERVATELDIDPGLFAATLLAEESDEWIWSQTSGRPVATERLGLDDWFGKTKSDTGTVHSSPNEPNRERRIIASHPRLGLSFADVRETGLWWNAGTEKKGGLWKPRGEVDNTKAVAAAGVYFKMQEETLRQAIANTGSVRNLDDLNPEVRLTLLRLAFNGGVGMAKQLFLRLEAGGDIPRSGRTTRDPSNAVRTAVLHMARAVHLDQAVFGLPSSSYRPTMQPISNKGAVILFDMPQLQALPNRIVPFTY